MRARAVPVLLATLVLPACRARQAGTGQAPQAASPTPLASDDESERWSFAASAYTYFVPGDTDYVQPTVTADRGPLHLEARYNYEALDTGSLWAGYNFEGQLGGGDDAVDWALTPMLGGVFGDLSGIAPGYKGSLAWWRLELYSEGEYVIDTDDTSDSFFYNWSELTLAPADWVRFGLVTQRTRAYDAERDVQRGLLLGFSFERFVLTAYAFNPDDSDPIVVVSAALGF